MRQRIGVVGFYDHANCGDESYKLSFPKLFPQYDFTFSDTPPPDADVAAFVLGGGDVVGGKFITKMHAITKPKHIMSATLSSRSPLIKYDSITVRDKESLAVAKDCGVKASLCPDFAFALDSDPERGRSVIERLFKEHELYERVIVVVANGYMMPADGEIEGKARLFDHFSYCLSKLADTTSASFLFLPFGVTPTPHDDRISSGIIASKCKFWKKNVVAYESLSVQETLDVISAADAMVSTRLHSSIFGCLCGTPFIDITHNHKNRAFLNEVNLQKLSMNYTGFGLDSLHAGIGEYLRDGRTLKKELLRISWDQKIRLERFAKNVRFL